MDQVIIKAIFSLLVRINKLERENRYSFNIMVCIYMSVLQKVSLYFHNDNKKRKKHKHYPKLLDFVDGSYVSSAPSIFVIH